MSTLEEVLQSRSSDESDFRREEGLVLSAPFPSGVLDDVSPDFQKIINSLSDGEEALGENNSHSIVDALTAADSVNFEMAKIDYRAIAAFVAMCMNPEQVKEWIIKIHSIRVLQRASRHLGEVREHLTDKHISGGYLGLDEYQRRWNCVTAVINACDFLSSVAIDMASLRDEAMHVLDLVLEDDEDSDGEDDMLKLQH